MGSWKRITTVGVVALVAIVGAAEAIGALTEPPDDPIQRVLLALPDDAELLINIDPVDMPSTSDIVRLGRPATPAVVNGLVNSMSEEVRSACAAVLTATRDPRALDALVDALDDPSMTVRSLALQALGEVESRKATGKLLELLRKRDLAGYVRAEAVRTLGRVGDPKAVEPLLDYFARTWDPAAQHALWDLREQLSSRQLRAIVVPPLEADEDQPAPPEVIAFAIERAGDLKLDDATDALEELFDGHEHLQNRIVYNLGRIGDRSAVKFLRGLLDQAAEPRLLNNVAFALDRLGEDVRPFLRQGLQDRRVYIRFNAAFVIGDLQLRDMESDLTVALRDPNDYVRSEAAVALGRLGVGGAKAALEQATQDDNAVVRRDALLALASADYANYRDRVVSELLRSDVPAVREKAGRFLASREDPQLVAPVLAAFDPDSWDDQMLGLRFLGQFDSLADPAATAWLLRVAAGGNNRHEALLLLARFADERAHFALAQWLTSPAGEQDQLLRAMGRYKDEGSAELARRWLEDPDEVQSQLYAAFTLASLGEPKGADRLLAALLDGPPEMKRVAAQLLTELDLAKHPAARDALLKLLDDTDVYVRLYAARALAQTGEARAFARLEAELGKRIPFIRDEVLDIVERAPRAHAGPVIKRWIGTSGPLLGTELQRILDRT